MAQPKPLDEILQQAMKEALKNTGDRLARRFREEFDSKEWAYPTQPKVRDIVDTGRLRDSEEHHITPEGVLEFRWKAPYATEVHEGGVTLDNERFPGRPWTRDPIHELPTIFGEELGEAMRDGGQR